FILGLDERLAQAAAPGQEPGGLDPAVAQWVYDHGQPAGAGTATLATSALLYLPLKAPLRTRGVLAVENPARAAFSGPDARRLIETYATLIAIALERLHYVEVAQQALVSMESEKLRHSLLAAVSHDLRTPLTSLVGMADTLAGDAGALPAAARDTVLAMREQARRMRALVVNLLDMARLQSREALSGHAVTVAPLSHLPLVECDGVLIERVLCNLLENAAKYTPAGGAIRLEAAVQEAGLQVSVSDDGPGVPAGDARRIFEKFTRGARESATPGVGLGLAVCEAIVRAHRGRIWVEPAPGQARGARFVFTLPLGEPPAVQPDPA